NGRTDVPGRGLGWALLHHGLDAMDAVEKLDMQMLAQRGGPYRPEQQRALLDYCERDVRALQRLLPRMAPKLDVPRGLLRGRYLPAVAKVEAAGIPIDTDALGQLQDSWETIKQRLVEQADAPYHAFDGTTFKHDRWARWVESRRLPWPRLGSGQLSLA